MKIVTKCDYVKLSGLIILASPWAPGCLIYGSEWPGIIVKSVVLVSGPGFLSGKH